jgi:hypothetical protein
LTRLGAPASTVRRLSGPGRGAGDGPGRGVGRGGWADTASSALTVQSVIERSALVKLRPVSSVVLAALVALVVLTGCESVVTTRVEARESGAYLSAGLRLDGEVAAQVQRSPELAASLDSVLQARFGDVDKVSTSTSLQYRTELTLDELRAGADLLGVSDVAIVVDGATARVDVVLVEPTGLLAAVSAGTAGRHDADALAAAVAENLIVGVEVHFPGPISQVSSGVEVNGSVARFQAPLSRYPTATATVIGSLEGPSRTSAVILVVAVALTAAAVAMVYRRRGR